MADEVKVNWYKEKIVLAVDDALQKSLKAIAFQIEQECKVNINEAPGASGQGLIDTSFLINSVYTVLPGQSNYGETWPSGEYENRQGEMVQRERAPEVQLPQDAAAAVAVGADYAIYQEIKHSFLIKAVGSVSQKASGLIKKI